MRYARALFGFRNQLILVSAILIPVHLYGLIAGNLPAEYRDSAIGLSVVAATALALVLVLACWGQAFFWLYKADGMPPHRRLIWACVVLLAPYGLIAFYAFVYRRQSNARTGWTP
jgi:hypothetical protein